MPVEARHLDPFGGCPSAWAERLALVLGVVVGLPLNALILYILIAPDALCIFNMVNQE